MFDTLADSQLKVEKETLGDNLIDAEALVDTLADSEAEVEAETLGDTLSNSQALVDKLADLRRHSSTGLLNGKQT